jgi:hypothetical protein
LTCACLAQIFIMSFIVILFLSPTDETGCRLFISFFFYGPEFFQWLRLALSNGPNWVGLSCPLHLRTETDPVSETLWYFIFHIQDDG